TASVSDVAGNPIAAEDSVELDNTAAITTSIDKTDDGVINGNGESAQVVVRGSVTDVEDGQTVTVVLSDGNNQVSVSAVVENGAYVTEATDVSAFADGTISATASVSDVAGNPIAAEDSVELDNTAAITTSIDKTDDGVINGNGESAQVVVRGSVTDVEDGQTVTVVLSDGNNQVSVSAVVENGSYVTEATDVSAFADGTISATASVTDVAGNPVVSAPDSVELDNTAAITTSIDKTDDGVINGNGESDQVVVRGSVSDVEDGQTVTVILSDGMNEVSVEAVVENGAYVTEPTDVSAFVDGTITATASVSDVAGNPISAEDSVELDNTAVITTSIDKTADSVINGNGESAQVVVRGSVTDVEDGQTVTVVLSDGTNEVSVEAVVENGEYVTEATDVSAFADGAISATASVTDVAGNPVVSAPDSVELDNTAAITTSIDKTDDGVINGNGESAQVVVRGSVTDVEDGQTVTVVLSDGTNEVSVEAVVENGAYVTEPTDVS
ncbi:hypothetical protein Q9R01_09135, partial [Vibrio sp. HB161653]|nr:hypothetical protein [Vibrio sp. HB161653]